jgi:hypothetical protein
MQEALAILEEVLQPVKQLIKSERDQAEAEEQDANPPCSSLVNTMSIRVTHIWRDRLGIEPSCRVLVHAAHTVVKRHADSCLGSA